MQTDRYDALMVDAYDRGAEHGRSAASWYFDGNTDRETYERVVIAFRDGDPAIYDTLPASPLSGEWAGDPTAYDVLSDLGIDPDDDAADDALSQYEDGFSVAVADTVEAEARHALETWKYDLYVAAALPYGDDTRVLCIVDTIDRLSPDTLAPITETQATFGEARALFLRTCAEAESAAPDDLARYDVVVFEVGNVFEEWTNPNDPDDDTPSVSDLARQAFAAFVWAERPEGGKYLKLRDDARTWIHDLVRDAHDGMLPDDWRYSCIKSALAAIATADDPDEYADEFADGFVDTSNGELIEWLGSHVERPGYVDEARQTWGESAEHVLDDIRRGQFTEAREVYDRVLRALDEWAR